MLMTRPSPLILTVEIIVNHVVGRELRPADFNGNGVVDVQDVARSHEEATDAVADVVRDDGVADRLHSEPALQRGEGEGHSAGGRTRFEKGVGNCQVTDCVRF